MINIIDEMRSHQDNRMRESTEVQMTLGKLIEKLSKMPVDMVILGLGDLDSYRGYYSDLAFDKSNSGKTVNDLLIQCSAAIGKTYTGYKGGEFIMTLDTPLWVAEYGLCGDRLMDITDDGGVITAVDD